MNTFSILLYAYIFVCNRTIAKFTALNDSPFVLQLYLKIRNEDAPSDSDPATHDPEVRKQICSDIFDSEWFTAANGILLNPQFVYDNRHLPEFKSIFLNIFSPNTHQYTNTYIHRRLRFNVYSLREYSFLCPVEFRHTLFGVLMFAVSKEYNVGPDSQPYKPGRFICPIIRVAGFVHQTILAEEPAVVRIQSSVEVERYYNNLRRNVELAPNNTIDPLCRLISDDEHDPNNQHYRLCAAVIRSSAFENIMYPVNQPNNCSVQEVSFRANADASMTRDEAMVKKYYERMTRCHSSSSGGETYVYISRAYRSNQVFVYGPDPNEQDKIFLVNLSTNVSIVDELNSFDFFED